jgi:hypothetical protein
LAGTGRFVQSAPQQRDVLSQAALFDKGVGPEFVHQLVFGQHVPAMLEEHQQGFEHLGRERHQPGVFFQQTFLHIQAERPELIKQ